MYRIEAANPDAYVAALDGWRQTQVAALREAVREAAPGIEERLEWGHLVYVSQGPVRLIRAEADGVLFGSDVASACWTSSPACAAAASSS